MSYDIDLTIDTGGDEETGVCDVGNYTRNCARMWDEALGKRLRDYDGRRAGHVLPELQRAVLEMEMHPSVYQAMNPANGWGDYEGALSYLRDLRDACATHPKATIRISC